MTLQIKDADAPDVIAPPPVLFIGAWMMGEVLHRWLPAQIAPTRGKPLAWAGRVLVGAGICLSAAVVRRFGQASTPVSPLRATHALVTGGPYQYSRNPDYLSQTFIYAGSSLAAGRVWPLLLLPAVLALVNRGVIAREERYLDRRFGAAYREYAARVPRWF